MNTKQKILVAVAATAVVAFTAWAVKVWMNTDVTEEVASVEDDTADVESAE